MCTHTHTQSNSLKRSVSPSLKCGTSEAKENRDHSAAPDKAKTCTVQSHEGKRKQLESFGNRNLQNKRNPRKATDLHCCVGAGGPGSHRPLLPCSEEAHAAVFVEVLLFDHDFGTVVTVTSSSFPGNRCLRMRFEFLSSKHLLPSGGKSCNGIQASRTPLAGNNLQPGPSHWGAQSASRAGSPWKEGGRSHTYLDRERPG